MNASENEKQVSSYDEVIEFLNKEKLKYLRPPSAMPKNKAGQGETRFYIPYEQFIMESKEQQLQKIYNEIEILTEKLNKLKEKSPEEKYRELELNFKFYETTNSVFIGYNKTTFEKLAYIALHFNSICDDTGTWYEPQLNSDGTASCRTSNRSMGVKFNKAEMAISAFDFLTDREIELMFGRCINR